MSHIYIEPARSNPEGTDGGKWKIMIDDNGSPRHLNDAVDHADAIIKAGKTASKRNIEFIGHSLDVVISPPGTTFVEPPADPDQPKYMSVPKPKGAPNLGDYVIFHGPDNDTELLVVDYLAEQFVGLKDGGHQQAVHVSEDWNIK